MSKYFNDIYFNKCVSNVSNTRLEIDFDFLWFVVVPKGTVLAVELDTDELSV